MAETWTPVTLTNDTGQRLNATYFNRIETGIDQIDVRVATLETTTAAFTVTTTRAQTGTSYTFVLSDSGTIVRFTSTTAVTATIPPNSVTGYPVGVLLRCAQWSTGQVSLVAGAGVTIRSASGLKTRTQYSPLSLLQIATDEWWLLAGDTATGIGFGLEPFGLAPFGN